MEYFSDISYKTLDKVDIIEEGVGKMQLDADQDCWQNNLHWLTPLDFNVIQEELSNRRQEGTCSWFLESQQFRHWKETKESLLVCQGMPGAGQ